MEGHLEALLEMDFCTKPPNFGVDGSYGGPHWRCSYKLERRE
jgi:hypothetical protein